MWEILVNGGPLIVPIGLGSVVALGVFFERMTALRRARVVPERFGERIAVLVDAGKIEDARKTCREAETAIGRIFDVALANHGRSRSQVKERVEEVGRRESAKLERYVGVLGVIASIEPLMGLLGTVTGMIDVFREVVGGGMGDPALLASGIWEALITTAAGLTVAIPVYIAWRVLIARVRDLVLEMEEDSVALIDLISSDREAEAA